MRLNGVLYFLLGDHLGSTSVSYKADGSQTITQRYKPWGEVRPNGLNALLTKFTYTGQYSHVDDFGLMFYNARWYDPALGRFAQADTIVPGMWNPGAFDRYSYVLNNPMRWVDPSGHSACDGAFVDPECNGGEDPWVLTARSILATFGVILDNSAGVTAWTQEYQQAVLTAVNDVGKAFFNALGGGNSIASVFRSVYEKIIFKPGCAISDCGEDGMWYQGWNEELNAHIITFSGLSKNIKTGALRRVTNIVHELGHAFNAVIGGNPVLYLGCAQTQCEESTGLNGLYMRGTFPNRGDKDIGKYSGFASTFGNFDWQVAWKDGGSAGEEFADMFLGWVYNSWQTTDGDWAKSFSDLPLSVSLAPDGLLRSHFMNTYMPYWLSADIKR